MFLNILYSHKEWRKLAKKLRRKRFRQKRAQSRNEEEAQEEIIRSASPTYQQWLMRHREDEALLKLEENRLSNEEHENWLQIEIKAQKQWRESQTRLQLIENERTKQQLLANERWEKEQEKLRQIKLEKETALKEKLKQQATLQESIESYIQHGTELPDALRQVHETKPGGEVCAFFAKTAACRFRSACSRNHIQPTVGPVLIIRNFYAHYSLDRTAENEHGSDNGLEFEQAEVYSHFEDFFHDVLTEMAQIGRVRQFKVCCNKGAHLRGNVYVEYASCREAILSYRTFHGRFYAGKQITVEFCTIPSWRSAICGLFSRNKCPKGDQCNYLHPFRNPHDLFRHADADVRYTSSHRQSGDSGCTSGRNWRWSESPEVDGYSGKQRKHTKKRPIDGPSGYKQAKSRQSTKSCNSRRKYRKTTAEIQ